MSDILSPTKERLAKSRHWDRPETDQKTERKASRVIDDVTIAWRVGKIDFGQYQAWEKFVRSWEGVQGHDVRVTDTTGDPSEALDRMPAWQFHGFKLSEAKSLSLIHI